MKIIWIRNKRINFDRFVKIIDDEVTFTNDIVEAIKKALKCGYSSWGDWRISGFDEI